MACASAMSRLAVATTLLDVERPAKTFTTSGRVTPAAEATASCVMPSRLSWTLRAGNVTLLIGDGM